jgi:hypothetical protein
VRVILERRKKADVDAHEREENAYDELKYESSNVPMLK